MQVREPQRLRVVDDVPEDPVAGGQVTDRVALLLGEPVGDELLQPRSDPGAITPSATYCASTSRLAALGDLLQYAINGQVRGDRHHGVEQPAEPLLAVQDAADALQELLEQLVQARPSQRRQGRRRTGLARVEVVHLPLLHLGERKVRSARPQGTAPASTTFSTWPAGRRTVSGLPTVPPLGHPTTTKICGERSRCRMSRFDLVPTARGGDRLTVQAARQSEPGRFEKYRAQRLTRTQLGQSVVRRRRQQQRDRARYLDHRVPPFRRPRSAHSRSARGHPFLRHLRRRSRRTARSPSGCRDQRRAGPEISAESRLHSAASIGLSRGCRNAPLVAAAEISLRIWSGATGHELIGRRSDVR